MVIKILGNLPGVRKDHRVNQVKMASQVFPVHQVRTEILLILDQMATGISAQEILASLHKAELVLMARLRFEEPIIGLKLIKMP